MRRLRLRVRGLVQGVGFRPVVWRLAEEAGHAGFVLNDAEGVLIEVEGGDLDGFVARLHAERPPLARIDAIEATWLTPCGETRFVIRDSGAGAVTTGIGADVAPCAACLDEMFDRHSRRHLYPFLSCTHCGPRFTVTRRLPYDRAETSLAPFPLCEPCTAEYTNPADRRFHAETTCCPACGPALSVPVGEMAAMLARGGIVALKGLGGFQLLCDARNEHAVTRLRERKRRDGKPFAVLVANTASARQFAHVSDAEATLLESRARPIVLLDAAGEALAPAVSNGIATLGLMLPSTPLHWLVLHALAGAPDDPSWRAAALPLALVATSANLSGEPLVTDDAEAAVTLAGIADLIAGHNRAIVMRADDSVTRIIAGRPAPIRRARGFVPEPVHLREDGPSVAAFGAHLKVTACVTRGREAVLSSHIGDLDNPSAQAFLDEQVSHLIALTAVTPRAVAHDLHPDFGSTRLAQRLADRLQVPAFAVQHHHAHIAAIAAEHRHAGPVLGLALDGFGLGLAGAGTRAWGGELLLVDGAYFTRLGHLAELPEPGGDRAAREPWRMAASVLHLLGQNDDIPRRFAAERQAPMLAKLLAGGRVPTTTSTGRLFDAVAGLLGVATHNRFEAEAAMRLETLATAPRTLEEGFSITPAGVLDLTPLLRNLANRNAPDGGDAQAGSNLFHGTFAAALDAWVHQAAIKTGIATVALGGGTFLNRVLVADLVQRLEGRGLRALTAEQVPCGDGGLSLGQAVIAQAMLERSSGAQAGSHGPGA